MSISLVPHAGWQTNLRLANDAVELIVSLEVGPRILSYRPLEGANILHNYPDHLGKAGETEWMNRGGHRLWIAPEDPVLSYALDNSAYPYEVLNDFSVRLITPGDPARPIRKDITIELAPEGNEVRLIHTLTNESRQTHPVAPWALTVMAPGGLSLLGQPKLGQHPRDLLPDRVLVLWPYSDPTDDRFHLGRHFVTLRQETGRPPFKFGLAHRGRWAAYLLGDQLFVKTVAWVTDAIYPDFGCNYESFTDGDMLEIESLGASVSLAPGDVVSHLETWRVFGKLQPPRFSDSLEFAEWLHPFLPQL